MKRDKNLGGQLFRWLQLKKILVISNLFKHEEDYQKLVRVGKFWINNYI